MVKPKVIALILGILMFVENGEGVRKFFRGRLFTEDVVEWQDETNLLSSAPAPSDLWFDQLLDHFNPRINQTWKQRYFENKDYYKPGGPIFLMIGGEAPASAKWMNQGAWIKYAKQFNAYCFQLEHRYYGLSRPTKGVTNDELVFLSAESALADLANFISKMNLKHNFTQETKWISFGGSYPGTLSAWLREKYPFLVHGAISSSGPLLAKADFREYFEVVVDSLATNSDTCVQSVQRAISQVEILLKHMIGQKSITEKFKLCDPIEQSMSNHLDIQNFFESLADLFAGVVQYSGTPRSTYGIDEVCNVMINKTITPIDRLAEVNAMLLKDQNEKCLDYKYDNMINELRQTTWEADGVVNGTRSWTYQTCNEFGFYQTSDNSSSVFGDRFNLDFFIKQCVDIFGPNFNGNTLERGVTHTNLDYGALNPATTNVLYVHGSLDPWHALGLTKSSDPLMPTIFIQGTAHCANMYEPRDKDLPQLKKAREDVAAFIAKLLK